MPQSFTEAEVAAFTDLLHANAATLDACNYGEAAARILAAPAFAQLVQVRMAEAWDRGFARAGNGGADTNPYRT